MIYRIEIRTRVAITTTYIPIDIPLISFPIPRSIYIQISTFLRYRSKRLKSPKIGRAESPIIPGPCRFHGVIRGWNTFTDRG